MQMRGLMTFIQRNLVVLSNQAYIVPPEPLFSIRLSSLKHVVSKCLRCLCSSCSRVKKLDNTNYQLSFPSGNKLKLNDQYTVEIKSLKQRDNENTMQPRLSSITPRLFRVLRLSKCALTIKAINSDHRFEHKNHQKLKACSQALTSSKQLTKQIISRLGKGQNDCEMYTDEKLVQCVQNYCFSFLNMQIWDVLVTVVVLFALWRLSVTSVSQRFWGTKEKCCREEGNKNLF